MYGVSCLGLTDVLFHSSTFAGLKIKAKREVYKNKLMPSFLVIKKGVRSSLTKKECVIRLHLQALTSNESAAGY
jgi:hypothetical protein